MERRTSDSGTLLDRAAIALSGLCMLHCLALPIVLIAAPVLQRYTGQHFHLQFLVFVVPVSLYALAVGYRRHRHVGILTTGLAGLTVLLIGATWVHHEFGLAADTLVTVSGSLILATAHYCNSRLARRHKTA